jgi:hypothetical protein
MKAKNFEDFKTVKDKVMFLLETNPNLRDNDDLLYNTFRVLEIGMDRIKEMSGYELSVEFTSAKYAKMQSIVRLRQMIQKEKEELRGVQYKKKRKRILHPFKVNMRD